MFNLRILSTILLFLGFYAIVSAQTVIPSIEWRKCIGGTQDDGIIAVNRTTDGGYIYLGITNSSDGDLTGITNQSFNIGIGYWVVKLNATGGIEWQKYISKPSILSPQSIIQTLDGGYIILGTSQSNEGNETCNHGSLNDIVLVKLSSLGDYQWQKCLGGSNYDVGISLIKTSDNGYAILGRTKSNDGDISGNHGEQDAWVVKLSSLYEIQWQKCIGSLLDDALTSIYQTKDNGFILAGSTNPIAGDVPNHAADDAWIVKLSSFGNIEWQKYYGGTYIDYAVSIVQTSDGGYVFLGYTRSNDGDVSGNHNAPQGDIWVVKLSTTGDVQWQKCLGGSFDDRAYTILQVTDGGYILAGYSNSKDGDLTLPAYLANVDQDAWIVKLSPQGRLDWQKSFGGTRYDQFISIIATTDGGYLAVGNTSSNDFDASSNHSFNNNDAWLVKLSPDLKIVLGSVQKSTASCQPAQTPQYLENIQVKIEGQNKVYYTTTDLTGHFGLIADTGRFNVIAIPPSNLWSTCLPEVISISKPTIRDTTFANANLFPNTLCPFMEVELTTPFLRRCFESHYVINYANRGTAIQNDAVVELTLDSMLTYISATRPVRSRAGNKISFSIGNVNINQVGQFDVTVKVNCDSRLGQTHCSSVIIPKTMVCDSVRDTLPAIITQCLSGCDSVLFLVKKPTTQNQNQAFQYRFISDASIIDTGRFVLSNDFSLKHKKDERTYRLELRNTKNQLVAARSQESSANTPSVSTGFVTQFANAAKIFHQAENCTANRGAFDPNDKSVIPIGVGTNHFIEQGTTVEYLVQFQNTGTDTAFKVVVKDTLSPHFNLSSYKTLASSHPNTWQLNPNGVLTFTFNNIKLVDSFTNEKLSHGFFRYQIRLKDSVATSTKIDNKAAIYFDFNTPIITNKTTHTVGKEFLKNCSAKPIVSITTTGCSSKNIVFNAVVKNGGLNPTYSWFRNNETTPLSINASFTLNNAVNGTKIYCKMMVSNDLCTETPIVTSDTLKITCINTKTEDLSIVQKFDIFPNPNKGDFDIALSLTKLAQIHISFLNTLGQVVKSDRIETNSLVEHYDFSHFPTGFYFVKVTVDELSIVKKIHIQH